MKKRVYKRAVEIAADVMIRGGFCTGYQSCPAPNWEDADCEGCVRRFLTEKAKEELRREEADP